MLHRITGNILFIPVENWIDVLAAGSSTGTPMTQAVFKNTWLTPTSAAGTDTTANLQYYKDPFGRVHLKGAAKRGTSVPRLTPSEVIFQLPEGYRPNHALRFACANNIDADALTVVIKVAKDGNVSWEGDNVPNAPYSFYYVDSAAPAGGSAADGYVSDVYQSFDGVSFRAEDQKS